MQVSLRDYPNMRKTNSVVFSKLSGGLNLSELDYRLKADESPEMRNMWWQDGVLQSRDGQRYITDAPYEGAVGYACYDSLFWGYAIFHIGNRLYYYKPETGDQIVGGCTEILTQHGVSCEIPENQGMFARYNDALLYKNVGGFYAVTYRPDNPEAPFFVKSVADDAYVPITVINASPTNGAGSLYEAENRLGSEKEIHYNAVSGVVEYHLPDTNVAAVTSVVVDGQTKTEGTDYSCELDLGVITFFEAPPVTMPALNNTVQIRYRKETPDAYNSIMSCNRMTVYGGANGLCVLLGGCQAQPNAVFWNGNTRVAMSAGYWPADCYNLVSDTEDTVSGFGRQYGDLIVFQAHSIGKLIYGIEEIDGLNKISFTYQNVNAKTGCDLPNSIQLIDNNLVFANRAKGVHILLSSSSAFENNVQCISVKVNGAPSGVFRSIATQVPGLLSSLQTDSYVCSFDDGRRYWLNVGSEVYVWDYEISSHSDPSWFYLTGISAESYFLTDGGHICHLSRNGRVSVFGRYFRDYDENTAIDKFYRFPTQFFSGYERRKDVDDILMSLRSDTDSTIDVTYQSDYETRKDLVPIRAMSWRLFPRNLTRRSLYVSRFAEVARRKPNCKQVRHFALSLHNNTPGEDMSIVSLQINYRYRIKER